MRDIQIYKIDKQATLPTRNYSTDAGLDIYASENVFIPFNETVVISTGVAVRIPEGFIGKIEDRSSMSIKGLRTGGGCIDFGYTGEVGIVMHNLNNSSHLNNIQNGYWVSIGDKVAQLVIYKIETPEPREVNFLWDAARGVKGYGSSGF
jgi:dUTP pyrophosphatase